MLMKDVEERFMGEGWSRKKTDFREPWSLDGGCNEFVHGVGKMSEFFGRIPFFCTSMGNYFLALRMLMMNVCFFMSVT
jgi:hypothetical protein